MMHEKNKKIYGAIRIFGSLGVVNYGYNLMHNIFFFIFVYHIVEIFTVRILKNKTNNPQFRHKRASYSYLKK